MRAFILFILIFDATFRREKDNISKSFLHTNVVAKRSLIHFKALVLPTYIMISKVWGSPKGTGGVFQQILCRQKLEGCR